MRTIIKRPIPKAGASSSRRLSRSLDKGARPDALRENRASYWSLTRLPIANLFFLLPLLLLYEFGAGWAGGSGLGRAGADAWLRKALAGLGLASPWVLPAAIVVGLLAWQSLGRQAWRFPPGLVFGMLAESLVFAVGLVGLSKLVDLGFDRLDTLQPLVVGPDADPARTLRLVGFLGAGIYEEAVFRLAMIPLFFATLRALQMPDLGANVLAVTASSLLFALAHHAGLPGESFHWYVFIFRWLAGIYFAWVFVMRGFGVAVATHAAYDVLVGYLDVSF